ncbi:MAG: PEP-CTERM sorting domain-containing protein [Gammaproteobacteria bacterium]|nr:PEP-CTERM sorting domain-containing protein [Gammaproteobacteria bacterium]
MKSLYKSSLILLFSLFASSANAALMLSISDGTQTEIFNDSDGNGIIAFDSDFFPGVWNSTIWPSVSAKGFGSVWYDSPTTDILHLNSIDGSSSVGGTLTIMLSETDITRGISSYEGDFGGISGGNITFQTYVDVSNTIFGLDTLIHDTSVPGGSFSDTFGGGIDIGNPPYSITLVTIIEHTGKAVSSFDYEIEVPEPTSLALIGIGLLCAGFATRRQRGKCA